MVTFGVQYALLVTTLKEDFDVGVKRFIWILSDSVLAKGEIKQTWIMFSEGLETKGRPDTCL